MFDIFRRPPPRQKLDFVPACGAGPNALRELRRGSGPPSTVSRALRLIAEGDLENGGVDRLADKLGVGSRHLRRLFIQHLGASPRSVARTRRLQFAKKLIDETNLPMGSVALASGFGCTRRFNAAIKAIYKRTPTAIRRLSRQRVALPPDHYVFHLRFRPPFDWNAMLEFLAPRATPGVEAVKDGTYRRSFELNGKHGYFEASLDEPKNALAVRVQFSDPRALFNIIERIRVLFDLNSDWHSVAGSLGRDPVLAARIKENPGLRVPGCWNGFELTVRAILGQQVTVKGATSLAGRLVRAYGKPIPGPDGITHLFPPPEVLATASLQEVGLPRARQGTIRALARSVCEGAITFNGIIDSEALLQKLCEIAGIGRWTAQYVAMRALGEPDAFPSGDLGLLRTLNLKSHRELEQRAEVWRPWRAYAAMYIWRYVPQSAANKLAVPATQAASA